MDIREAIAAVSRGTDMTQEEAAAVMEEIMTGVATPAQVGALLTALHIKGETYAEIAGMARVMRACATPVPHTGPTVDTCGTGGDHSKTFNISTTVAFVVAGAGLAVAKHGNRGMTSASGSADVLEALGVKIDLEPADVVRCLDEASIGFMFAPVYHPAMRFAGPVRREIGIRTVFNLLGPLTNPANAAHQVVGVSHIAAAEKIAHALRLLDTAHSMVVHGDGGLDELSLSGPSQVYEVRRGHEPEHYTIDPARLGLSHAPIEALRGGNASDNAATIRAILTGEERGPKRDIVLLNAAAALVVGDAAPTMTAGLELAGTILDSGKAMERLDRLVDVSNRRA